MAPEGDRNDSKREPRDPRHRSQDRTRSEHDSTHRREDRHRSTHHPKGTSRDTRDDKASTHNSTIKPPKRSGTAPNRALSPPRRSLRRVGTGPVPRGAASPDLHPDLSQTISNMQEACNTQRPAMITAAENKLLARLEDMPITHQIYILNKILTKMVDKKYTPQLRAKFDSANHDWKENNVYHTKAIKKAYERLGKIKYDLEEIEKKIKTAKKQAAVDKKFNTKKIVELKALEEKLATEKPNASKALGEKLEKAAQDQPAIVLDYLSLMKLENMYFPRMYIRARTASMEAFCGHDIDFLRMCQKEVPEENSLDRCLVLCYQAYVHRRISNQSKGEVHGTYCGMSENQEDDDSNDYKSQQNDSDYTLESWKDMMKQAATELPSSSRNNDALSAIDVLEKNELMDEARYLCEVSIWRYQKKDPTKFEQKLEVLKKRMKR